MIFSSHTLTVSSPAIPTSQGQPALEPVRLSGREGVNSLFDYQLLLKTPDALNLGASGAVNWDLDSFIGREISCTIELDGAGQFVAGAVGASVDRVGAGQRQINALITDARFWGEEGRHAQYQLTLRPWLHLATLSSDCKIFQNQTVVQILDELLGDYAFPLDKRLIESYPPRDYQCQFNETDHQFFERLCQENGISYFFEHSAGKHRLVLIDNMGAYQKNPSAAYQQVDYHPPGWKTDAEYLHSVVPHHQLTSGRYASSDYDYTRPRASLAVSRSDPRPTGQADGEVYQWHHASAGSHYAQPQAGSSPANDPQDEGRNFALLRLQALRTHGARARASGNLRGMVPGCSFLLQKHPRDKANTEYLILETQFLIEDVAQDSQIKDAAPGRKQQWKVEVDITAHPLTEMLRPALAQAKPVHSGPQVARVVGPAGENLWTDALGRIKVQFPWDRLGQANQHSSCWVRVSSSWAGNQLGGMHVPRIGQEVLIDFIGGDTDLPVCTGRVNNQNNLPPWALPGQSALSGFRSRELTPEGGNSAAGRSNHLVMDDTAGQIQVQLKSDHQSSALSLGHITRIEDNAGRKDARGEGFELRSDGHGVVRAADGLLVTTEGRSGAAGHAKAMQETIQSLAKARDQMEGLAQAAVLATAQDEPKDQSEIAHVVTQQNDSLRGLLSEAKNWPELTEPHLLVASPNGISATAAETIHVHAAQHVQITGAAHASMSAGRRLLASAEQGMRLLSVTSGIKMFAADGKIDIHATYDAMRVTALQNITVVSTEDTVYITSPKKVLMNGGTSFSDWSKGLINHGTLGSWTEHSSGASAPGPDTRPVPAFPSVCLECLLRANRRASAVAPQI